MCGVFINTTMYHNYTFKAIYVREGSEYKTVHLIAVPYRKADENGFRIYKTDNLETFYPHEVQPLIGAILFETEEKAIHAGELVLRLQSRNRKQ
jgi:hypothetical protein